MGIKEKIHQHRRIMFDTAPVIYFIEEHPTYGSIADEIFKVIKDNSEFHAFSSVITLTEVLTYPLRESDDELAAMYREFLSDSVNFTLYDLDPLIAEQAAKLRGKYGLRTPDAIQIATGIENGGTLFITNDKRLRRIEEIEIMVLEDYLEDNGN
ncbi:MAG: type II toxin-antitoxin system VapC family toxin [Desulfobacterales bacterium]|nr:type II toxin-antitoxin system VapC family toxin [Desulfobacterales bacterium]